MSKQRADQALSDIERISKTARKLFEDENWMELASMFDHMEQAAHRGFNQAYQLFNTPHDEPHIPESRDDLIAAVQ